MAAVSTTRKRKQTDDMEVSPPKRVTRARTAKTQDNPAGATKTARTNKPAITAKATGRTAKVTASTAAKRATRSKDPEPASEDANEEESEANEPPKTRGRPKKTAASQGEEDMPDTSRSKTRTTKAAAPKSTNKSAPVTKARPRTRAATVDEESEDELVGADNDTSKVKVSQAVSAATKRSTRGRPATNAPKTTNIKVTAPSTRIAAGTRATGATAATAAKAAASKKVAFSEEAQDKENVPLRGRAGSKAKADEKPATGIRAKPVRKAAAATTTKTRDATTEKEKRPTTPLSPKKVDQVAKGHGSSSEDELGSKSPGRLITKSPIKPPQSVIKTMPFGNAAMTSPAKHDAQEASEAMLSKTPIKPPQSVRKQLPFATASPSKAASQGETADSGSSLLNSPAKRPAMSSVLAMPAIHETQPVNLLASPAKRVQLDVPKLGQEHPELEPTTKQTLLQSPPRRPKIPIGSKTALPKEKKSTFQFGESGTGSDVVQVFNFSAATPRRLFPKSNAAEALSPPADATDDENHVQIDSTDQAVDEMEIEASPSAKIGGLDFDDTIVFSPYNAGDVGDAEDNDEPAATGDNPVSTTPLGLPSTLDAANPSTLKTNRTLFREDEAEDSDDELSVSGSLRISSGSVATPTPGLAPSQGRPSYAQRRQSRRNEASRLQITPLANQFSNWLAAGDSETDSGKSAESSPAKVPALNQSVAHTSPVKPSYFEDEMIVRESEVMDTSDNEDVPADSSMLEHDETHDMTVTSFQSQSEYGDENAVPIDPQIMNATVPLTTDFALPMDLDIATADPLELNMTPPQAIRPVPREVMTVSKIPLKPSDEATSSRILRERKESLAPAFQDASLDLKDLSLSPGPGMSDTATPPRAGTGRVSMLATPTVNDTLLNMSTPFKTPRYGADARILRGAVIFVDVHTEEGSEASGLFADLLTSMGARCVKQWSWSVRSSSAKRDSLSTNKVGITHVVFKDGGKRTLEKVREAQGLVHCVGVGWVLDCERENKWLDETEYTLDTTLVPRGGHNRRKSMEPQALANVNGTLRPASGSPGRSFSTPTFTMSPTKEFLTFSNPGSPADGAVPNFDVPTPTINFGAGAIPLPETPVMLKQQDWDFGQDVGKTPVTPYLVNKGTELVQATCPPKQQTGRMLFPVSGKINDEPDEDIRRKLVLARRKSLQWAPKIGSPLRRS